MNVIKPTFIKYLYAQITVENIFLTTGKHLVLFKSFQEIKK